MRFLEEKWTLFLIFILLTIVKFEQVAGDTSSKRIYLVLLKNGAIKAILGEEASEEASEEESEEENSEETNGCFDIGTNCKQIKRDKLCRNSVYISITKQYCRETCGEYFNILIYPSAHTYMHTYI